MTRALVTLALGALTLACDPPSPAGEATTSSPAPSPVAEQPIAAAATRRVEPAAASVTDSAGRISGRVRYTGSAPLRVKQLTNDIDVTACGERITLQTVLLGADGAIGNVFVELRRDDGGLPLPAPDAPAEESVLAIRRCRLEPHVLVMPAGNSLLIQNADGVLHHLVAPALRNEPFDARLPRYRKRLRLPPAALTRPETLALACDVHPWEAGFLIVSDNPLRALTDGQGRFAIDGVPAGTWRLTAWHEDLKRTEISVTLAASESVETELIYR